MSSTKTKDMIRKAGLLERFHITRQALGLDTCVVVSARYVFPTDAPSQSLTPSVLYPALAKLIKSTGALCVCVAYSPSACKKPAFVPLHSINLDKVVQFTHDPTSLQDVLEQQIAVPFDINATDRPLWRLTVLPDNTVVFAYQHGIGDGLSGRAFHLCLLEALRAPSAESQGKSELASPIVDIPATVSLVPPLEKLTKLSVSFKQLLHEVTPHSPPSTAWRGNPVVPRSPEQKNHVRLLSYSPADSQILAALSRSHSATITGALHVVAAQALARVLSLPDLSGKYDFVPFQIPMSLRPLTNQPPTALCDHVSNHIFLCPLPPARSKDDPFVFDEASWRAAAELSATLRATRDKSRSYVAMLRFVALVGGYRTYFKGKLNKEREGGLALINLGAFPKSHIPSPGGSALTIADMAFTQEDGVVGEPMKINVIGGGDGSLTITCSWSDSQFHKSLGEMFAVKLDEGVKTLVASKLEP
ncbi:hypothetical protein GLOTRDRAFT_110855 [Gloeophyllum trabeum ATCC 11539]|uniref:Alcohol acetyltransferase n=1 Tax=Gloeophyllum trabeum (strain ATCC 11539 / FP-39264 / Madison 617) TaxID=670483 RepID=S7QB82_GLOTA|nr:uncharacterized protein GLOTRDRAFT_110855 [Gloeophyllum trabeum ATCC 11539]EPQ56588.1 hypothetical protein GLOTRDRAFT_110855 [Gloeophyllum trabeum ATCC 11539]